MGKSETQGEILASTDFPRAHLCVKVCSGSGSVWLGWRGGRAHSLSSRVKFVAINKHS